MNVFGVIIYSTLGSVLGAIVLYGVGYILNQERLERILDTDLRLLFRPLREMTEINCFALYVLFFFSFEKDTP